uniref:P element homolog (Lu-P1 element) n=1 Tax=Lucilia cuprina TaxID=7375 RepID=Q7M4J6_LUCCU
MRSQHKRKSRIVIKILYIRSPKPWWAHEVHIQSGTIKTNFLRILFFRMPSDINMETDECLFLSRPSPSWTSNVDPSVPSAVLTESFPTEYTKTYVNQETQTEPDIFAAESAKYVDKIRELERENKELNFRLKMQVHNSNMALHGVNKIFTEGQIRKLEGCKKIVWKSPDISSAICLHAAGPRAYNHLKKGFPLPHVSTLQRWCQKVDVHEGLLKTSLGFMQQATYLSQDEKICVLAFDEMKVAETFEYDCTNDVVRQPAKYVQVVMARGLKKSWKQPVFYDFDCRMSKQILDSIISELSKAGFPVLAIVCDMGPTNRKLWSDLGATTEKPWFPHPVNTEEKVYTFVDAPHLLKLIRNHYIDTGLIYNGEHLTSRTIADVLQHTNKCDTSITFKLSDEHLLVKGAGRQKVKLAAQLFSNTTASAIRRCYTHGKDIYKPLETAELIQTVNNWFDVVNSSMNTFGLPGKEPYGVDLESQQNKLEQMNQLMAVPIIPGRKSLEPFQKGILMTNRALVMLYDDVKKYDMTYILTNRLNQDVLEHFFGAIRSKGGLNDHPSPQDFKFRLRKYILARNTEYLNGTGNVENDNTEWLNSTNFTITSLAKVDEVSEEIHLDCQAPISIHAPTEEQFLDLDETDLDDIGILQEDALEYISGYIIRKHNLEEYQCRENTFTWVDEVSKGSLKKPSNFFLQKIKSLEVVFYNVNGREISHRTNLRQHLLNESSYVDLPERIKQFFFRCRIFFRIRNLNKHIKVQKQVLMGKKKMIKTIL